MSEHCPGPNRPGYFTQAVGPIDLMQVWENERWAAEKGLVRNPDWRPALIFCEHGYQYAHPVGGDDE